MTDSQTPTNPKWLHWTGRVISGLVVLMLLASAAGKFTTSPELTKGFDHLGWPEKLAIALGITEIVCTLLYAIPYTSVLGAILLTGYMGGAIATHVRVGDPFFVQIGVGVFVWLGLFLRDHRLRAILPLRSV